ncbi:19345_t:CDS:1, partial [Dentiscutata erythropus]
WYRWNHWCLWALSAHKNISIVCTMMILESHWRILKHDFLLKFNRPRLDVLCHIIINRMLSRLIHRYSLLITERIQPSWKKDFKAEWKKLVGRELKNSN